MNKSLFTLSVAALTSLFSCTAEKQVEQIVTTEQQSWITATESLFENQTNETNLQFAVDVNQKGQVVDGFGACFNELGWTSLSLLTEEERESIMNELFTPGVGANFNICRMPVAANDFALDWYSYNETKGDFAMENFSIDNDKKTLIPFIKAALKNKSDLKIWGSPWSPPTWMKRNQHYAMKPNALHKNATYHNPAYYNGLTEAGAGKQGMDMFIQEPEYLEAYALYFAKYIEAYKEQGIDIFAVMPQNEFNSDQIFPSCCWKSESLANFIGGYLGPKMKSIGVEVMLGTMERADHLMVDTVLTHPEAKKYVSGVGFQWAGKGAIGDVHKDYPNMKLYQTEQECGDGKNNWKGVSHSWDLLKHYFDNGTSAYMYWNISLLEGGISHWGWTQNSLVVVDPKDNSYHFTGEYYLMKHISHYVQPGAHYIKMAEDFGGIVFQNPDNSIVVLYMEKEGKATSLSLTIGEEVVDLQMTPNSINTFII